MIYKAVEVICISSAGGPDGTGIEGSIRGPRGPKNQYQKAVLKIEAPHWWKGDMNQPMAAA